MRIAQVAPLIERIPPKGYGGTERVVAALTEELVRRGHDVVLFASGDSATSAELVPCCPVALRRAGRNDQDPMCRAIQLGKLAARGAEFDIIHNHLDYHAFPLGRQLPTPMVTTLHGRLDLPGLQRVFGEFPEMPLVSISDAQRTPLGRGRWLTTVYNGVELGHFTLAERPGKYLAFLGRISPEKGPDRAIQVARAVGMPLRIAAKIDPVDQAYFVAKIKPLFREPGIEYVGEVDEQQKDALLRGAYAYLFPIRWPEPFGITMIEAMACGTPVIATDHGSVREVVDHGRTGFICRSVAEMIHAIKNVGSIDRRVCRAHVAQRFSVARMADSYEAAYRALRAGAARRSIAIRPVNGSARGRGALLPGIRTAARVRNGGGNSSHSVSNAHVMGPSNDGGTETKIHGIATAGGATTTA